jgi:hypothetical protein
VRPAAALLAAVALVATAPAATAATRGELSGFADRVSKVWAGRQDAHGYFLDPATGHHQGGYGNVMIGYGLLRAGVRASDAGLVRAGLRGVDTALGEKPSRRGVFDLLAMAAAYNFARRHLARDPAFAAARPRWERYLHQTGAPNIDNKAQACIVSPVCFHNHEAVGATADLELLATRLRSRRARGAIRRGALQEVGVAEPSFAVGLLSDSGVWPLAYHALSTAMLGRSIDLLGRHAPRASRRALRRTVTALRGFIAPDGTVAYIGRRQEDVWSLAATVTAAEIARDQSLADRAFGRIKSAYPLTSRGLPIVPRRGADAFSEQGVDGKPMTFNGLSIYLLNVAADAAPPGAGGSGGPLRADSDGAFVDDRQNGFAAVRHGDVWFAVHRRRVPPDLRNDFGLMAAKWRSPSGAWVDILRPRPMRFDAGETAGPVIERAGQRLFPAGDSIAAGRGGEVTVRGRIGVQPASFRYTPTARGVRMSVRAQPGDVVVYTAYVPEDEAEVHRGAVSYPTGVVKARPRASSVRFERGFASCCDAAMAAARMRVRARGDGVVTFTVSAHGTHHPAAATHQAAPDSAKLAWWLGPLAVIASIVLAATVRRRSMARRRRRPRRLRV